MIKYPLIIFFLFCGFWSSAGCRAPSLSTNVGIYFYSPMMPAQTAFCAPVDSFNIGISSNSCGFVSEGKIYLNGALVAEFPNTYGLSISKKIKFLPGQYKVTCYWSHGYPPDWTFNLALKLDPPKELESISLSTGEITLKEDVVYSLSLFPNPAKEYLTVNRTADKLTEIKTFDHSGRLIDSYKPNNSQINIPLEQYPPGIYIIQVSTLSHKPVIRKFSIL